MELFTLFGKIGTNHAQANSEIDSVTDKAKDAESKISSTFKKVGTAIVAAFAVDKIIDFGKKMVETTADIQALDSQFTQTFKDNAGKAMDLINKQSKDQNIQVDRLRGTWSSFFGTFRGNGADVNQSLDLTKQYMNLAADGAAYYDTSLEDVVSRLKSITMGNYEAGDAIGININATKLDTIAKEKYHKKLQDLSDTEREYLIIDTASKIYKNSGAMGQAAREANNYSNVVENLRATWNRFISILGAPVLSVVVTVLSKMTDGISQLTAKMQSFSPGNFVSALANAFSPEFIALVKEMVNWIQQLASKMQDTAFQSFGPILGTIQGFLSNLWLAVQPVAEALGVTLLGAITIIMSVINLLIPIIATVINNFIQFASMILSNVAPAITIIANGFSSLVQTVTDAIVNYIIPLIQQFVAMIQQLLAENKDKLTLIASLFGTLANAIANKVNWIIGIIRQYIIPFILEIVQFISQHMDNIKGIFQGALNIIAGILNVFIGIFTGDWSRAWEGVKQIFSGAWDIIKNTFKIVIDAIIKTFKEVPGKVLEIGHDIINYLKQGIENKVNDVVDAAKKLGKKILDGIKDIFGIHSPSREMFKIGDYLMQGFMNGIKSTDMGSMIKNVFGDVTSIAKGALGKPLGFILKPLIDSGAFEKVGSTIKGVIDKGINFFSGGSSGASGNLISWITTAMGLTGTDMSLLPALQSIAMHESGGDPKSINLWDSNAMAGTPSKGIMQMIDETFNRWALPGMNDIWNPIDNIVSAIRYMVGRYGSVLNVPGIRNLASGKGYVGYATGTDNATKGQHPVGENGLEIVLGKAYKWFTGGEKVLNNSDSMNFLANIRNTLDTVKGIAGVKLNNTSGQSNNSSDKPKQPIIIQLVLKNGKAIAEYIIDDLDQLQGVKQILAERGFV